MKKFIALFSLIAVCCLSGCSNVSPIFENDERLYNLTDTGYEERYSLIDAKAEVYDGEYESFEIPDALNITRIVSPASGGFLAVRGSEALILGERGPQVSFSLPDSRYGIYSLDGEFREVLPRYIEDVGKKYGVNIAYCNEEYVLYYMQEINQFGFNTSYSSDGFRLHLLKLDDMIDKVIYILPVLEDYTDKAVIIDNVVYFEVDSEREAPFIMSYDIGSGERAKVAENAEKPAVYKGKLAYFVDGRLVSYAGAMVDAASIGLDAENSRIYPSGDVIAYEYGVPAQEYGYPPRKVAGYIRDDKNFDIFKGAEGLDARGLSFMEDCAVWTAYNPYRSDKSLPMFYSDKHKSVIAIEDERADYTGFIQDGRIYFFGKDEDGVYKRALVMDTENI